MSNPGHRLWALTATAFTAAGAAVSFWHYYSARGLGGALDVPVYIILSLGAGWFGALAGGAAAWRIYKISPAAPLFPGRFGWHYERRYWLRFATVFTLAWAAFVALAVLVALGAGAYEEAGMFFTPRGGLAVLLFMAVFWAEGALVGGLVDLLLYLAGKEKSSR